MLSGAGEQTRSQVAMDSVYKFLARKSDQLIQLLDPPFNHSNIEPGYIKGYVPGVRENGGQYTHAAIWTVMAFAKMGDTRRTWELLQMLNPVNHGKDEASIARYKTEPYVVAADVYGFAPHTGRGGMDLVHRFCRLVLSIDHRVVYRSSEEWEQAWFCTVCPKNGRL